MNNNDEEQKPVKILIRYYCNHFDTIESNANELESSNEIKEQVYKLHKSICGTEPESCVKGLNTLCKIVLDNDIKY